MVLLNFSHPITNAQRAEIADELNIDEDEELNIKDISCHLDLNQPLAPQIVALADAAKLSSGDWWGLYIVINPPALSIAAVMLAAEMRGRCGHSLPVIRFKLQVDAIPPVYVLAEVIDLDSQHSNARERVWQTT